MLRYNGMLVDIFDMEHDAPNAKRLKPKAPGKILWQFTKACTFDFSCLIPGHRKAGLGGVPTDVKKPLDPPNVGAMTRLSPATLLQETEMQQFNVPTMTCGHCVKTITQAVQSVDPVAKVHADLATHSIGVTSSASVTSVSTAIAAAGYANTVKA